MSVFPQKFFRVLLVKATKRYDHSTVFCLPRAQSSSPLRRYCQSPSYEYVPHGRATNVCFTMSNAVGRCCYSTGPTQPSPLLSRLSVTPAAAAAGGVAAAVAGLRCSRHSSSSAHGDTDSGPSRPPLTVSTGAGGLSQPPVTAPSPFCSDSSEEQREEQRKRESSWRALKYTLAFLGVSASFSAGWILISFGSPARDPDGNVMTDEFSAMSLVPQYLCRSWREIKLYSKMIKDPSRDLLLPDPLQYPYHQPPYTLVLELTGVLVHPDWTYKTGWRFKKRPAVSFFLQQIGPPLFEVVVYTNEQGFTAHPIVEALDPNGYIMYRLFKDSTRYMNSQHVKDLTCLNRDLSKVIMIDWNKDAVQLNPRNHLRVDRWDGDDSDRDLVDLAMMLKAIATSGVKDVREVMDHYRQYDNPLQAFRENQRLLREQEANAEQQQQQPSLLNPSQIRSSWLSSFRR